MMMHSRWHRSVRRTGRNQTKALAVAIAFVSSCGQPGDARAQTANARYPSPAPIEQYRSKSQTEEIALARSAAPPSISAGSEVLVLGEHGYETAVKG